MGKQPAVKEDAAQEYAASAGAKSSDVLKQLKTLPYVSSSIITERDEFKSGIVHDHSDLSSSGSTLFCSRDRLGAYLIGMDGGTIQEFFDKRRYKWNSEAYWHFIEPYDTKSFLVVLENEAIFKIDWDSNILWGRKIQAHHDVAVAPNGDIYVLTMERQYSPQYFPAQLILDNYLVVLSRRGDQEKTFVFRACGTRCSAS